MGKMPHCQLSSIIIALRHQKQLYHNTATTHTRGKRKETVQGASNLCLNLQLKLGCSGLKHNTKKDLISLFLKELSHFAVEVNCVLESNVCSLYPLWMLLCLLFAQVKALTNIQPMKVKKPRLSVSYIFFCVRKNRL